MMKMMRPELLSPAGSIDTLHKVIAAGADAVYIGSARFSARAYAENPQEEDLLEAIDYAHLRGVKVYLTVNTLFKEEELHELADYIRPYVERGIDAVLVQDFGVLKLLSEAYPFLPLHASTQMTVTGPESALFLKKYGVTRVVPAREMSLTELKAIHEKSGLEVETFIHGALCYSLSGQCLMSSVIGGRSGNRGRCAQPCRLPYECQGRKGTLLSLKDLCTLDLIPKLIESGVISFKIEGRMKQSGYAAGVTAIYRKYLDRYLADPKAYRVEEKDRQTLLALFSREGFTDAYLKGQKGPFMLAPNGQTRPGRHDPDLYETFDRLYSEEKKIPVTGLACLIPDQPMTLTVSGEEGVVTAVGSIAQPSTGRPLSEDKIRLQLSKTGGTAFVFEDLTLEVGQNVFAPVSQLNDLRREALSLYKDLVLEKAGERAKQERGLPKKNIVKNSPEVFPITPPKVVLTASFERQEQYQWLLEETEVKRLYYPIELVLSQKDKTVPFLQKLREETNKRGKELYLALPYLERAENAGEAGEAYTAIEDQSLDCGFDGILVRSFEGMARLLAKGLASKVMSDASLYSWNSRAAAFFRENGIGRTTLPVELKRSDLTERARSIGKDRKEDEMIVYGRLPLMVSAQCLKKNTDRCTRFSGSFLLKDRTDREFPVRNNCFFCQNVIYNSLPLSLLEDMEGILGSGISSVRLAFTDEEKSDIRNLIEAFSDCLRTGHDGRKIGQTTRGHYRRGVQ